MRESQAGRANDRPVNRIKDSIRPVIVLEAVTLKNVCLLFPVDVVALVGGDPFVTNSKLDFGSWERVAKGRG